MPGISMVRTVLTTSEVSPDSLLASYGITAETLSSSTCFHPKPARVVGPKDWDAFAVPALHFDAIKLFTITEGTYVPKFSSVIARGGVLLDDLSLEFGGRSGDYTGTDRALIAARIPRVEEYSGRLLVVDSAGVENPFHWIVNVLPKLVLAVSAQVGFDAVAVRLPSTFHLETFQALGGLNFELVPLDSDRSVRANQLLVSNLPCSPGATLPSILKEIRRTFRSIDSFEDKRRLYVSRQQASGRRLKRSDAVEEVLRDLGFEFVFSESMSHSKRREIFGSASVILGVHGAGLTNMIYAPDNCRVIEIMNPGYRNVAYWLLAESLDLEYTSLVGEGQLATRESDPYDCYGGVSIDPKKLRRFLLDALGDS